MHKERLAEIRKRVLPLLVLIGLAAGGYYLYATGHLPGLELNQEASANTISGYVEGDEVSIVPELGGRIVTMNVEEGDIVSVGQELVKLDRSLLDAQILQAQAAVDTASAELALVKAGPRPEDVRQAQSAVAQAEVARDGARQGWENAQAVRANPQELDARVAASEAQYKTAKFNYDAAVANAQGAATRKDAVGGEENPNPNAKVIVNQWVAAEAAAQTAQAAMEGARQNLEILRGMRANPLTANAQVDAARAQYDAAGAAVGVAQARLDAVKAGPSAEQIAVAAAQVKQAQAALEILQVQAGKLTLKSPLAAVVTRRAFHVGEVASPGNALLTLVSLDPVKLTIYVPESRIGQIKLGMAADVKVDSYPDRVYSGKVIFIGSQAEFTPRNVQTKEERVNTVFAVKIELPNPTGELKPGMPADAALQDTTALK